MKLLRTLGGIFQPRNTNKNLRLKNEIFFCFFYLGFIWGDILRSTRFMSFGSRTHIIQLHLCIDHMLAPSLVLWQRSLVHEKSTNPSGCAVLLRLHSFPSKGADMPIALSRNPPMRQIDLNFQKSTIRHLLAPTQEAFEVESLRLISQKTVGPMTNSTQKLGKENQRIKEEAISSLQGIQQVMATLGRQQTLMDGVVSDRGELLMTHQSQFQHPQSQMGVEVGVLDWTEK